MSDFGVIKSGASVEAAMKAHVEEWFSTYLRAVEPLGDYEKGSLEDFRTIETDPEFDRWPEDQIPGLLIVSPGMVPGSARTEGNGKVRGKFVIGLGIVCSADNRENSSDLAQWYGAAMGSLVLQKPSLGGFARGVELKDISYDDLGSDGIRTQASSLLVFEVEVPEIFDVMKGPLFPDDEPGEAVVAEEANVTVTRK